MSRFDPAAIAAQPGHFIAGAFLAEGPAMPVFRPSDGAAHGEVHVGDEALVDRAVAAAKRAQPAWAKIAPRGRARVLRRWADAIDAHAAEIACLESVVSARLYDEAIAVDVANSAEWLRFYAECCDKIDGALLPTSDAALAVVAPEPYGVVGAIAPWNFPLILAMWKVAPALAAGNAIVLKPSEFTPFSIARVAQLALEAGLPPGLFNVVHGEGPTVGAAIVRHPDIAFVAFTGSTATGRRLMADAAAAGPKPVGLELGGKGAQLVFADAGDLDHAARHIAWGITRNGGQLCYAGSRLIVHASLRDALVERVIAKFRALSPKRTWEAGEGLAPILNERQAARIEAILADSLAAGAELLTGGARLARDGGGVWIAPTILGKVTRPMRARREEIFGPVLTVQSFEDEDEGIALASDSEYGLSASVYSRDIARAVGAARRLPAGTVWINRWGRAGDFTAPFGGWKQSGVGQEAGLAGYRKYLREKAIWFEL